MSGKFLGGLALLACLTLASHCRAGDVTVDNVTVTLVGGTLYQIEMSGTLSLANTGGGYEQWAGIACKISQPGTNVTVPIGSLTAPTLTANGSYVARVQVNSNAQNANWTATATITWYKNAQMQTGFKDGTKAITIP